MAVQQPNAIYQAFRVTPCHNAQFVLRSRDGLFGHLSARHGIHLTAGIDSTSAMGSRESSTCTSVILAISGSLPPPVDQQMALSAELAAISRVSVTVLAASMLVRSDMMLLMKQTQDRFMDAPSNACLHHSVQSTLARHDAVRAQFTPRPGIAVIACGSAG